MVNLAGPWGRGLAQLSDKKFSIINGSLQPIWRHPRGGFWGGEVPNLKNMKISVRNFTSTDLEAKSVEVKISFIYWQIGRSAAFTPWFKLLNPKAHSSQPLPFFVTWMPPMAFRHQINQSEMTCCFQILPWPIPVSLLESGWGLKLSENLRILETTIFTSIVYGWVWRRRWPCIYICIQLPISTPYMTSLAQWHGWEDARIPVLTSCLTISNPNSSSSSKTGTNLGIWHWNSTDLIQPET